MTSYTQLTHVERYQIHALRGAGRSLAHIARALARHVSTICRELSRNSAAGSYLADRAQQYALSRRQSKVRCRISGFVWLSVRSLLELDWSPEQASLWLAQEHGIRISHEWIYQYIYHDKHGGGHLHRHLRCQKPRRKRYGSHDRRGRIRNRISIDERPAIVEQRSRLGDWEIDTIIGAKRSGALISLTERRSRYVLIAKLPDRSADEVAYAALGLLEPLMEQVHTITADNGREFSGHEEIAEGLAASFYFAHPYSPWERGTNENANGLIRQYFPKRRSFATIKQSELDHAMDRLNNRPRKCLDLLTPNQVLYGINQDVALAS